MAIEIERRFLVEGEEWRKHINEFHQIRQGYFSTGIEDWVTRIRITNNDEALITIKKHQMHMINHEFEYQIPIKDAESIWSLMRYKISKKRFSLNIQSGSWVVDCFEDKNAPLIIAEVELDKANSALRTNEWCKQEITGIQKYSNASLAKLPFSNWSIEKINEK